MGKLEDMLKEDGWEFKLYWNCGIPYFAWHKNGFQIDECGIDEIDKSRKWEDA